MLAAPHLRRRLRAACLLIALAAPPAAAQALVDVDALAAMLRPSFDPLLRSVGIDDLPSGSPEWEAVLQASARAVLRARPPDCAPEAWFANACGVQWLRVPSRSMVPTLLLGDAFFLDRVTPERPLVRGDIVVFHPPGAPERQLWTFRIIGLPGERVQIQGGVVLIDGTAAPQEPLQEPVPEDPLQPSQQLRRAAETLPGRPNRGRSCEPDQPRHFMSGPRPFGPVPE